VPASFQEILLAFEFVVSAGQHQTLAEYAFAIPPCLLDGSTWRGKICKKGRASMEDTAARRAAEALLAEHKANLRFKPLGPPQAPASNRTFRSRACRAPPR
jgi:hypothetical protein